MWSIDVDKIKMTDLCVGTKSNSRFLTFRCDYISTPECYGDLVYKFKKINGNPKFSYLFKNLVHRLKKEDII